MPLQIMPSFNIHSLLPPVGRTGYYVVVAFASKTSGVENPQTLVNFYNAL